MTTSPVSMSLIWDPFSENPIIVPVGEAPTGKVDWGMDAVGGASVGPDLDRGTVDFVDLEGALDPQIRAADTELTPGGRRATAAELNGWQIGVALFPAGNDTPLSFLWTGFGKVSSSEGRWGATSFQLQSSIGEQLSRNTDLVFQPTGSAGTFDQLAVRLRTALRIRQTPFMQTGADPAPTQIKFERGTGFDLLKQFGLYALGTAVINLDGQPYVVSRDNIGATTRPFEPVVIQANKPVDLKGDVIADVTEIAGSVAVTQRQRSFARSFGGAVWADGLDVWFQSGGNARGSATFFNPRSFEVGDTRSFIFDGAARFAGAMWASTDSLRKRIAFGSRNDYQYRDETRSVVRNLQYPSFLRAPDLNRDPRLLDISLLGSTLFLLYSDGVRRVTVQADGQLGIPSVHLPFATPLEGGGFLSVTTIYTDVYDTVSNRVTRYDAGGASVVSHLPLIPTASAVGLASTADELCTLVSRNAAGELLFYTMNFRIETNPSDALPVTPDVPRWKVVDPVHSYALRRRPQLRLAVSDLSAKRENGANLEIGVESRLPRVRERLEAFYATAAWSTRATQWMTDLYTDPVEFLQFELSMVNVEWQWVAAINRRLDVGTRVEVIESGEVVSGMIVGRGIEWDRAVLKLRLTIWISSTRPFDPDVPANALTWRGEALTWRGEFVTWR